MQDVFNKLRDLQGVLAEKFTVLAEVKEIPKTLETKEELLHLGKKTYVEKHERLDKTVEELKSLRIALDQAEVAREDSEKMMEQISTQREYEALEKEIREAAAKEQSLRKSLLAKEKYLSELQEQLEEHEQLMEIQEEEVKTELEIKESLLAEKQAIIDSLEKREQELIPGIDDSTLFKFERIIKNKEGLGIVPIHGTVCQGCHVTLPTQFVNDVRKGEELMFCPYCSRVTYYEDPEHSEEGSEALVDPHEIGEASMVDFVDTDEFDDIL
ncbi:MAG: zinc ribbon domain-containing protein [Sphaerochaetaceae bacterium]|jgi:predicted  nucleic acid-binding Zn-ribbon protein